MITDLAIWLNNELNAGKQISSHSTHKSALKGSDFVISAIEVQPREQLWQQDFELSRKVGLRQPYGENGGPGGALRTLPEMLIQSSKSFGIWKFSARMRFSSTLQTQCTGFVI